MAMDRGHVSLLGLLDLSAAFDTVDFGILWERLEKSYGIVGSILDKDRSLDRYFSSCIPWMKRPLYNGIDC